MATKVRTVRSTGRYVVAAAAASAVLLLAGCGGDDDDAGIASAGGDPGAAETSDGAAPDEQGVAFAECVRGEGIDMPDPVGEDGLIESFQAVMDEYEREEIEAAMAACEDQLPPDLEGQRGNREPLDEEIQLALAECLREQGLDVPDNLLDGGLPEGIDRDDLRAAMEQCQDVIQ